MSSDLLMAKYNMEPGTIDLSIGEPHILQHKVREAYNLDYPRVMATDIYEYPAPYGYKPLVDELESRYNAKVVVTNGAKQGLYAAFVAAGSYIAKSWRGPRGGIGDFPVMYFRKPYWFSFPSMCDRIHLDYDTNPELTGAKLWNGVVPSAYNINLLVTPNNPDGYVPGEDEIKELERQQFEEDKPLIHDAAYNTRAYIRKPLQIGDMQVYSASKMYGLSGFRLGYVVCRNEKFYEALLRYQEETTVGVSTVGQRILYQMLNHEIANPTLKNRVEDSVYFELARNRHAVSYLNPDVFDTDHVQQQVGMFAWVKLLKEVDLTKSKVRVAPGEIFGMPGYMRLNLAVTHEVMTEAINRLNAACGV